MSAGTSSTKTKVTSVIGALQSWILKYKVGTSLTAPTTVNSSDSGYSALTIGEEITTASGEDIVVVATTALGIVATSESTDVVVG